jgi:CheY-like chemotaxis protein
LKRHDAVLVVEDDPNDRMLFEEAWRRAGIDVPLLVAANVPEALALLRRKGRQGLERQIPRTGLVLLDIKLPGLNGFDLLQEIRSDPATATLPVVMLSSSNIHKDIDRAYALGANGYVVKPTTLKELGELLLSFKDWWVRFSHWPSPAHVPAGEKALQVRNGV